MGGRLSGRVSRWQIGLITGLAGVLAAAVAWATTPPGRCVVPTAVQARLGSGASCARRLQMAVADQARVGRPLTVTLQDRWRLGGLTVRLCRTAPGGIPICERLTLEAGDAIRRVTLSFPRPGGWQLVASTPGGRPDRVTVWTSHPGHRLTLLAAGDSEMQVLDEDLQVDLAPYRVRVIDDAREGSGLTVPGAINWQAEARRQVLRAHPDITVVSMGANDGYGTPGPHGGVEGCCGAAWAAGYGRLVTQMARTLLDGGAGRVYWVLLATPRPGPFQALFNGVNTGIRDAAAALPGRFGLVNLNAYFTPHDVYRNTMTHNGAPLTIHEPDGVHLDAAADAIAAHLIIDELLRDRVLRPLRR